MAHTPAHYPNLVKKYARPLARVYAIFPFAIEYSAKAQHTTTGVRAPGVAPLPPRGEQHPVLFNWLFQVGYMYG